MSRTSAALPCFAFVLAMASSLALAGCEVRSSKFCGLNPDDPRCHDGDAAIDATPPCTGNADCAATPATPACLLPDGVCVACAASSDCTDFHTPVCDPTAHTCRTCAAHAECELTDACLDDGTCAQPQDVAYVSPAGTTGTVCDKATPCLDAKHGVETLKPYVRIYGSTDTNTVKVDHAVTLLGDPPGPGSDGSHINGLQSPTFDVRTGAVVAFDDLLLTAVASNDNPVQNGIAVQVANGQQPMVAINRCTLAGHAGPAVSAEGGTIAIRRSNITRNVGGGLVLGTTSTVTSTVVNNFITHNGAPLDPSGSVGGVSMRASATTVFEFNTVVDNRVDSNIDIAGVSSQCVAALTFRNNLIAHNTDSFGDSANVNTSPNCSFTGSMQSDTTSEFHFVNTSAVPFDYHQADAQGSAHDMGTGSDDPVDFDGDIRPQGAAPDVGADEFVEP